jgi:glycosyltransferase involved in cell wall biosynthesis
MKKIMIITAFAPNNNTAGQAFTMRLLKDIARDHLVDLCFFHDPQTAPDFALANVKVLFAERLTFFRRLLGAVSAPFLHPLFTSRFSMKKALYLRSIAHNYDAVYFDFSQTFIYAPFIRHRNKVALAHDIITQMYDRRSGIPARFHALFSKFSERLLMRGLGARLYCFSEKDCRLVAAYFGESAGTVDFYLDERIYEIRLDEVVQHNRFVFYGAWGRRENSSGLLWFLANVMPLLDADCRFIIIGSGVTEELREAAQVFGDAIEFSGFVDNPYPLLAGARALVAPLFEGAGVKVKVLEALACGTPVIGTEVSFEGIAAELPANCQSCTNDAAAFAHALNTPIIQDRQQARAAFLAAYPRNTMGDILRHRMPA